MKMSKKSPQQLSKNTDFPKNIFEKYISTEHNIKKKDMLKLLKYSKTAKKLSYKKSSKSINKKTMKSI